MIRVPSFDPRRLGNVALWLDAADVTAAGLWTDRSGLGRNAVQAATNSQPAPTGVINGRKAMFFDGINDNMAVTPITLQNCYAFVVCQPTDNNKTALYIAANGTPSFSLVPPIATNSAYIEGGPTAGAGQNNPSWVDGRIGAAWNNGSLHSFFSGLIGEVLVYSATLPYQQVLAVERYLKSKWRV